MRIRYKNIELRDFSRKDVADVVRWMTRDTEWHRWDAPWEAEKDFREFSEKEYLAKCDAWFEAGRIFGTRLSFQLYASDGKHIGMVNSYLIDEKGDYLDAGSDGAAGYAVGIDICEESYRGGRGKKALSAFIRYLLFHGISPLYLQTWDGNLRMRSIASKLGFEERMRDKKSLPGAGEVFAITYVLNKRKFMKYWSSSGLFFERWFCFKNGKAVKDGDGGG